MDIDVILLKTTEIPGRTVCQIPIQVDQAPCQEGLVEPLEVSSLPKHLLVARTLIVVGAQQDAVIQIANTNPTPTTLYEGSRLGTFTPQDYICVLESDVSSTQEVESHEPSDSPELKVDLDSTTLSSTEKMQLLNLLADFSDLFSSSGGPMGRTGVVKHSIHTMGPPI